MWKLASTAKIWDTTNTDYECKLPPGRNPRRWFNKPTMSIAVVNKAEQKKQKHTSSCETLSTPTSPRTDGLELWFALPKQAVEGGQASHPGPKGLCNISTSIYSYNFHINPEARFGGICGRVNLRYKCSSVYARTQMSSKQMKVNMRSQWIFPSHLMQDLRQQVLYILKDMVSYRRVLASGPHPVCMLLSLICQYATDATWLNLILHERPF